VVLSILSLLLYPFLWAWTIIGTLWFTNARDCVSSFLYSLILSSEDNFNSGGDIFNFLQLPEEGQKWGFLIWLLFSYCGLIGIACISVGKVIIAPCTSISLFNFTFYCLP
jgi:E3 ubiquitin-protein ligase SIS3